MTTRSASFAIEETLAQLDSLHERRRARVAADFDALKGFVGRLDESFGADDEPVMERHDRRPEPTGRRTPPGDSPPFVPLPQRTTPGGPFGPAVRAKLTAEALEKGGW